MSDIVDKAREYIGTPYKHQGRLKGVGVDCIGLVICVAKELGLSAYDTTDYGRIPQRDFLLHESRKNMHEISYGDIEPGDVILFEFIKGYPQHFAIYAGNEYIIHSYESNESVVEHRMCGAWKRRIAGVFRIKR